MYLFLNTNVLVFELFTTLEFVTRPQVQSAVSTMTNTLRHIKDYGIWKRTAFAEASHLVLIPIMAHGSGTCDLRSCKICILGKEATEALEQSTK